MDRSPSRSNRRRRRSFSFRRIADDVKKFETDGSEAESELVDVKHAKKLELENRTLRAVLDSMHDNISINAIFSITAPIVASLVRKTGGAREFVIPNGPIPTGATMRLVP